MTVVFLVGLAVAQAAPIGSALREGTELVYESRGVAQAPWVYDSVRVVARQDFDRCIITLKTETDEDNLAAWKWVREEAERYLRWALERS